MGVGESETMEMAVIRRKVEASRGRREDPGAEAEAEAEAEAAEGAPVRAVRRGAAAPAAAPPPRRRSVPSRGDALHGREHWRSPAQKLAGPDGTSLSIGRPGLLAPADENSTAARRTRERGASRAMVEPYISPVTLYRPGRWKCFSFL